MPRKKKDKPSTKVYTLAMEKQIDGSPVVKDSQRGWISWGQKNDYPYRLLDLYNQSPTHHSAIQFAVQSIVGGGVDLEAMKLDSGDVVPNYRYGWDELLRSLSLDYMLYGMYCLQIIKNKDGKTYSFYHVPFEQVRFSPYDEDGVFTSVWISADWTAVSKNPPVELPIVGMDDDDNLAQGKAYAYVYTSYSPATAYYSAPQYVSALKAIQNEVEIVNFDLRQSLNNFTPAGMLTLPPVATDEEKNAIIANIQKMFIGTDNANSLMITFREDSDDSPVQFTPFEGKQTDVDLYSASNQRTIDRILAAHQIPSRSLIGIPDEGGSGFNSEAALLETAYNLYNTLTGNYNRNAVIKSLNLMFKMNNIQTEVIIKPLTFLENSLPKEETTETEEVIDDTTEDNVEEQRTAINQ